ncbi:MAG: Helix-turn-helix domain [Actinomycetota bacterium]|nr:Helix-turn-helix domain [Actinomycetota bacterium]
MLDVREAARLVGRTPETVRRWIWSGRLTATRHGNKLLLPRGSLDELTGQARPTSPLTLAAWAEAVDEQRRAGNLADSSAGASAADLVLEDRPSREAG